MSLMELIGWIKPLPETASNMPKVANEVQLTEEATTMKATTIGIDLAKNCFPDTWCEWTRQSGPQETVKESAE